MKADFITDLDSMLYELIKTKFDDLDPFEQAQYAHARADEVVALIKKKAMEVVGEDDREVRGTTQNPDTPNYHTKRTKFRNELRAEQLNKLKSILGEIEV